MTKHGLIYSLKKRKDKDCYISLCFSAGLDFIFGSTLGPFVSMSYLISDNRGELCVLNSQVITNDTLSLLFNYL